MIRAGRRTTTAACVVALALLAAGCGNGRTLEADDPPTPRAGRFPAAVVSTTTLVTSPFGQPARGVTTTTRKGASPAGAAPTTAVAGPGAPTPAPRVRPADTPMPSPRTALAGAAWQGLVVAAGGFDAAGHVSARVDAYDPASGTWQRGPDLPEAVHDAALAVLGDDLYLIGGFALEGDQAIAQAATYFFHAGDTAWKIGPNLKTPRGGPSATTVGDTLIVFGGETTDGGVLDTVETLAGGSDEWRDGPPLIQKRAFASAIVSGGRVYAAGGRVGGVSTALAHTESWKPGDDSWRRELNLTEKRASGAGSANCISGGEDGDGVVGSVECVTDRKWTARFHMSVPRHGLAAAVVNGWLHLVGGGPRPGPAVNAAHEIFDLA